MTCEYKDWQVLATAPRDGTRILLLYTTLDTGLQVAIGRWHHGYRAGRGTGYDAPYWHLDQDSDSRYVLTAPYRVQPTHWMPIPIPKAVLGVVTLLSDEPEVHPVTNPAPTHGVRFHDYNVEDDHVVVTGTRKGLMKWAGGEPSDENIQETWKQIRAANAAGITPWVFVDPYESDLHGRCVLCVAPSREDAHTESTLMAQEL